MSYKYYIAAKPDFGDKFKFCDMNTEGERENCVPPDVKYFTELKEKQYSEEIVPGTKESRTIYGLNMFPNHPGDDAIWQNFFLQGNYAAFETTMLSNRFNADIRNAVRGMKDPTLHKFTIPVPDGEWLALFSSIFKGQNNAKYEEAGWTRFDLDFTDNAVTLPELIGLNEFVEFVNFELRDKNLAFTAEEVSTLLGPDFATLYSFATDQLSQRIQVRPINLFDKNDLSLITGDVLNNYIRSKQNLGENDGINPYGFVTKIFSCATDDSHINKMLFDAYYFVNDQVCKTGYYTNKLFNVWDLTTDLEKGSRAFLNYEFFQQAINGQSNGEEFDFHKPMINMLNTNAPFINQLSLAEIEELTTMLKDLEDIRIFEYNEKVYDTNGSEIGQVYLKKMYIPSTKQVFELEMAPKEVGDGPLKTARDDANELFNEDLFYDIYGS